MALLAWVFFRFMFSDWILLPKPDQYIVEGHHPYGCTLYGHGLCLELPQPTAILFTF